MLTSEGRAGRGRSQATLKGGGGKNYETLFISDVRKIFQYHVRNGRGSCRVSASSTSHDHGEPSTKTSKGTDVEKLVRGIVATYCTTIRQ